MTIDDVIAGYAATAPDIIASYEAIVPSDLYAPVIDLFPKSPGRIADIGCGTGRDAAWLAAQGHAVLAVEPTAPLREAGMALHRSPRIQWLDDRLPELGAARHLGRFDLVLMSGVWHHVREADRDLSMVHLAEMVAPGGLLIMSLRHGPGAAGRPGYPIDPNRTIDAAAYSGLSLLRRIEAESIQSRNRVNGVSWTWLAFTNSDR